MATRVIPNIPEPQNDTFLQVPVITRQEPEPQEKPQQNPAVTSPITHGGDNRFLLAGLVAGFALFLMGIGLLTDTTAAGNFSEFYSHFIEGNILITIGIVIECHMLPQLGRIVWVNLKEIINV